MHASKSRLGNDITKSYIPSFAQEYSGEFMSPFSLNCFQFYTSGVEYMLQLLQTFLYMVWLA
ncbi:hypothetical protein Hanom_Chr02g00133341 [Helianthus anomalus]